MNQAFVAAVAIASGACAEPEPAHVEGAYYQYVVGEIRIPANNSEARDLALDLNGDKTRDNQLGMVFATLQGMQFDIGSTAQESLLRGNALLLAELQTPAFDDAAAASLRTDLGEHPDPAACGDPAVLATCGRHLETRASFGIVPETGSSLGVAEIDDHRMVVDLGTLPVAIGIDAEAPARVDLVGSRVELRKLSADRITAVITGGVTVEAVESVVVPEAARNLARIVSAECGVATGEECGCPLGSRGRLLQGYFDADHDCAITRAEVAENPLTKALLSPDIEVDGRDALSFGFGADLVPASFTR